MAASQAVPPAWAARFPSRVAAFAVAWEAGNISLGEMSLWEYQMTMSFLGGMSQAKKGKAKGASNPFAADPLELFGKKKTPLSKLRRRKKDGRDNSVRDPS